jgi:hypothetical protein
MCKVKDLIKYLETLNPETAVDVLKVYDGAWETDVSFQSLILPKGDERSTDNFYLFGTTLELGKYN